MAQQKEVFDLDSHLFAPVETHVGNSGKTRYAVSLGEEEYSFFPRKQGMPGADLFAKASSLVGQDVSARVSRAAKKDGDGFWLNLEDIAPRGMLPGMALPAQGGTPAQAAAPQAVSQLPPAPKQERGIGWQTHPVDAGRMSRSAAAATAANFLSGSGAPEQIFRELTERITLYTETGSWEVPAGVPEQPKTAQEVATMAQAQGADVQVGALPWQQQQSQQ